MRPFSDKISGISERMSEKPFKPLYNKRLTFKYKLSEVIDALFYIEKYYLSWTKQRRALSRKSPIYYKMFFNSLTARRHSPFQSSFPDWIVICLCQTWHKIFVENSIMLFSDWFNQPLNSNNRMGFLQVWKFSVNRFLINIILLKSF